MVFNCVLQSLRDQLSVCLRSCNPFRRFLLERMQNINGLLKPNRIHRPKRVAAEVLNDLEHSGAIALPRLGVPMLPAKLRRAQRITDMLAQLCRKLLQVFQRRTYPKQRPFVIRLKVSSHEYPSSRIHYTSQTTVPRSCLAAMRSRNIPIRNLTLYIHGTYNPL